MQCKTWFYLVCVCYLLTWILCRNGVTTPLWQLSRGLLMLTLSTDRFCCFTLLSSTIQSVGHKDSDATVEHINLQGQRHKTSSVPFPANYQCTNESNGSGIHVQMPHLLQNLLRLVCNVLHTFVVTCIALQFISICFHGFLGFALPCNGL